MGGAAAVDQQHKRGSGRARERIEYLFDPGGSIPILISEVRLKGDNL